MPPASKWSGSLSLISVELALADMELDRKQLQVSYAIPQGWETFENAKWAELPIVNRLPVPLAEASISPFAMNRRPQSSFFVLLTENRAAAAACQSISPGPPVPQSRLFLGTQ